MARRLLAGLLVEEAFALIQLVTVYILALATIRLSLVPSILGDPTHILGGVSTLLECRITPVLFDAPGILHNVPRRLLPGAIILGSPTHILRHVSTLLNLDPLLQAGDLLAKVLILPMQDVAFTGDLIQLALGLPLLPA